MNNTYNMVVRPETAAQYKLETLSDLGQGRQGTEARRRPGIPRPRRTACPGLKAKYGMEFKEDLQMAIGLALPGARQQADRRRQRLCDRRHDQRAQA